MTDNNTIRDESVNLHKDSLTDRADEMKGYILSNDTNKILAKATQYEKDILMLQAKVKNKINSINLDNENTKINKLSGISTNNIEVSSIKKSFTEQIKPKEYSNKKDLTI